LAAQHVPERTVRGAMEGRVQRSVLVGAHRPEPEELLPGRPLSPSEPPPQVALHLLRRREHGPRRRLHGVAHLASIDRARHAERAGLRCRGHRPQRRVRVARDEGARRDPV